MTCTAICYADTVDGFVSHGPCRMTNLTGTPWCYWHLKLRKGLAQPYRVRGRG